VSDLIQRVDVRLINLTGPGGVGKTHLGLAVATSVSNAFSDGVAFVSLAPVQDAILVMPTIAQTLGLREAGGWSWLEHLQAYLQDKHLLLFLDNFEQVAKAAPYLVELLQTCPQLHIVVTSRMVLHVSGEHVFPVPPLALPDPAHVSNTDGLIQSPAVALFVQHARAIAPDFQLTVSNARTIREICVRLDGLPLAIELAATRIQLLPPHVLLARLDQRLQLLTRGMQDAPQRHQTLRQTIQWSYDLLQVEEQRLFRKLAIFVGGCTLEAVEAVIGTVKQEKTSPSRKMELLDEVASLFDQSLIQPMEQDDDEPRLFMLETIREYGLEMLVASREMEESHRAHALYYLRLAEEGEAHLRSTQQIAWLKRLEREHANLRAALAWLIDKQETYLALRLCSALGRFWDLRGYWSEGRHWFAKVFALPSMPMPTVAEIKALRNAGELAARQNEYTLARQLFEKSLSSAEQLANQRELASSLGSLWLLEAQDDFLAGRPLNEQSVERCYSLDSLWERTRLLEKLGHVALHTKDIERAKRLVEDSLRLARQIGDTSLIARALHRRASIARVQGDLQQVAALIQECLVLAHELDDKNLIALSLNVLSYLALRDGNLSQAWTYCQDALKLVRELGDRVLLALELNNASNIALRQGELDQAEALAQASLTLTQVLGDQISNAHTLHTLGDIAWRRGDAERAVKWFQEGSHLALAHTASSDIISWYLLGFARVADLQGQIERAVYLYGAAEAQFDLAPHMDPVERTAYEYEVSKLRLKSGEIAFKTAWHAGRTMTPEQALALTEAPSIPHPSRVTSSPSLPDDLTVREKEVLRLLAAGMTNIQIANQLIISPLTVNAHVRSIYSKLGVSTRAAAARYAFEHHLV
jgi:predicted ATPase/DNA-binding CsgD family transcriptional regulator